jgi:hypothetical protein
MLGPTARGWFRWTVTFTAGGECVMATWSANFRSNFGSASGPVDGPRGIGEDTGMSEKKDNLVRVDFKRKTYVDDDRPIEVPREEPEESADEERASTAPDEEKFGLFSSMIEDGLVLLTFDTRAEGVSVPEQFMGTPQLHLSFSYRFQIEDFEFDEIGLSATLSFNSGDHVCVVPWDSVYAMQSRERDEKVVFPSSFPSELLALLPTLSADSGDPDPDEGPS